MSGEDKQEKDGEHNLPVGENFKVLARWRNAVSVVKTADQIELQKFDKKQERWVKILFFRSIEDLNEFIDMINDAADKLDPAGAARDEEPEVLRLDNTPN